METKKNFYDQEAGCELIFRELGECWHLWTPENFEIIFTSEDDFKLGMNIVGIGSKLFPDVKILTFELMTNHLHITASGSRERVVEIFEAIKGMLKRHFSAIDRTIEWKGFTLGLRKLENLRDVRNVIVYDNRNGYVVGESHTPFSYPWGANRYFFNPDARELSNLKATPMTFRERLSSAHSHCADKVSGLLTFEGYALPTSFCDIETAEKLFRSPSCYFYLLGKNIEANVKIAREIGEGICYTDDELFAVACRLSREKFNTSAPSQIPISAKQNLARTLRYDYNASAKQLIRMLKIPQEALSAIGIV